MDREALQLRPEDRVLVITTTRCATASSTQVIVADVETLIRTKMTTRPSDAADRAWLESLRKGGGQ